MITPPVLHVLIVQQIVKFHVKMVVVHVPAIINVLHRQMVISSIQMVMLHPVQQDVENVQEQHNVQNQYLDTLSNLMDQLNNATTMYVLIVHL